MSKKVTGFAIALATMLGGAALAAPSSGGGRTPAKLPAHYMDRFKHQSAHARFNHLSAQTKALIAAGANESNGRLRSFPSWNGSFSLDGTTYPYTMVGRDPRRGGSVEVDTALIMLSFSFDEFVDAQGNNIVIDSSSIVDDVVSSPNFVPFAYTDGKAQFSDAVQRASFFNVMQRDWHTSIDKPRMLTPVTIEVPVGLADVFVTDGGSLVGFVDDDFLFSQLQTILQLEGLRTDELPLLVSSNVSAVDFLGFHDAIDVQVGHRSGVQTYLYTSWFDVNAFGPVFADATTITHEISEWMADPFVNNIVPDYVIPNSGGACQNFLEVGDPIEFLDNQEMDVTVRGHLYHTQTEVTVQWFSREVPSSAFRGAYSYPDLTVLTAPSDPCPTTN